MTLELPELPERYFWRVRMGVMSISHLELRKKVGKHFSRKIDSGVLHYYDSKRNVLEPSHEIVRVAKALADEFYDPWVDMYGDYPPKTLEEKK